ncbi:MAG TPA: hypothetical protein ENG63_00980 [Candidatus Desulfofervidus auxilii]|uniref:Uncharacterized protein n=1 Tax=Desulfofervidus auxilii TaxID=1621989 RepID=A0A7C0U197_DESA2|nr:hypothetical protein [Candidatus Desulfofervidus auxilii]
MKDWVLSRLEKLFTTPKSIVYFVHNFIGYYSEEKLLKSKIYFSYKPLLTFFFQTKINKETIQRVNSYLGLPDDLPWPYNRKGKLRHPKSWTKKFLKKHYPEIYLPPLLWLRKLVFVEFETIIDVPNHIFFLIKAAPAPFSSAQIEKAYACGELLKKVTKYDEFQLITITTPRMVAPLEKIHKALSWKDLENVKN